MWVGKLEKVHVDPLLLYSCMMRFLSGWWCVWVKCITMTIVCVIWMTFFCVWILLTDENYVCF